MAELLDLTRKYINYLINKGYSKNTIKTYEINLRYYYSFCNAFKIDFKDIKGSDMIEYVSVMSKYKSTTINMRLSALRSFYEYLINMDIVRANPVRQSLCIRQNRKKPRSLTRREESLFVDFIESKDQHIELAFKILLNTGIRISELTSLTIDNFIEINDRKYVEIIQSKNDNSRIVPLSNDLYDQVLNFVDSNVYFGRVFSLSNRAYQYHADQFSLKYNINFSVHSLRHTYATRKSQEKLPVQIIQKLLGHKDISTTMYYVEVTNQDILNL